MLPTIVATIGPDQRILDSKVHVVVHLGFGAELFIVGALIVAMALQHQATT